MTDGLDARFADIPANDRPLRLRAEDADDIPVVSALLQDAVGLAGEVAWMPRRRRLALVLNRFRWEDREAAGREGRPVERVRSVLLIDDVTRVRARGLDPQDKDTVFSILSLGFDGTDAPSGMLTLILAGDGDVAVEVECLSVTLADLTRPWAAPAGKAPEHPAD